MSRFYSSGENSRGNQVGHPVPAGTPVHTRGWTAGVEVVPVANADGSDTFEVYMTCGSNSVARVMLGKVEGAARDILPERPISTHFSPSGKTHLAAAPCHARCAEG